MLYCLWMPRIVFGVSARVLAHSPPNIERNHTVMAAQDKKTRREDIDYESEFTERLTQLRMLQNISSRQMSMELGQNEGYMNKIENGKTMPSMEAFFLICAYLKITPEEFFLFCSKEGRLLCGCDRFLRLPEKKQGHIMLLMEDLQRPNFSESTENDASE